MVHMLYADQLSVVLDCGEQSYGVGVRWVLGAWRVSETVDWNLLAGRVMGRGPYDQMDEHICK